LAVGFLEAIPIAQHHIDPTGAPTGAGSADDDVAAAVLVEVREHNGSTEFISRTALTESGRGQGQRLA